jgi:hypothetical protein
MTIENSGVKTKSDYVKSSLIQEDLRYKTGDIKISTEATLVSTGKVKNATHFEEPF